MLKDRGSLSAARRVLARAIAPHQIRSAAGTGVFPSFAAFLIAAGLLLLQSPAPAFAQEGHGAPATATSHLATPEKNFLSDEAAGVLGRLIVQDYQGRMKPLDTFALEMVMKVTKKGKFEGWRPLDLYLSWLAYGEYWIEQPLLYVHHPGTKEILSIDPSIDHVVPATLWDGQGRYRIAGEVESTLRTPASERSKARNKLLSFDEEFNLFLATLQGRTFRVFPVPGDANHSWTGPDELESVGAGTAGQFQALFSDLLHGIQTNDDAAIVRAANGLHQVQVQHGSAVLPKEAQLKAELILNRLNPFVWVMLPYLVTFVVLAVAYAWSLARHRGEPYSLRHPLYLVGWIPFVIGAVLHLYGYVLRWIASGRAPLSNGYESLIFISLVTALAGMFYELRDRRGSAASLSALLTIILLGVAMLPTFDPAISPVVPVLASFWLIIHVSIITASYAFLGLAAFISMTVLLLHLFKGPGRGTIRNAIQEMNQLHWGILVTGVAFLSIGTLLGGVWANESWGRYWGWDPKETWALITIFFYGVVVHFRFVEKLNRPVILAAGSFLSISSVVMTYFGVNYLLSGLHSYGAGESAGVPPWIYVTAVLMVLLVLAGLRADGTRSWSRAR